MSWGGIERDQWNEMVNVLNIPAQNQQQKH